MFPQPHLNTWGSWENSRQLFFFTWDWRFEDTMFSDAIDVGVAEKSLGHFMTMTKIVLHLIIRTRSDFEKHLTMKNCDKTFLKIILR